MPDYVVEIGRVLLRSNKPITPEERKRALQLLRRRGDDVILTVDGTLDAVVVPSVG